MRQYTVMRKPASALCNLRCKYCFYCDVAERREARSFGKKREAALDTIFENLKRSLMPGDWLTLAFQCGEPMLAERCARE